MRAVGTTIIKVVIKVSILIRAVWNSWVKWGIPRGGVWGGSTPPPPKFRNFDKVPKIKKILLYEMRFVVPNYSCKPELTN
jgi:hypothetical protein